MKLPFFDVRIWFCSNENRFSEYPNISFLPFVTSCAVFCKIQESVKEKCTNTNYKSAKIFLREVLETPFWSCSWSLVIIYICSCFIVPIWCIASAVMLGEAMRSSSDWIPSQDCAAGFSYSNEVRCRSHKRMALWCLARLLIQRKAFSWKCVILKREVHIAPQSLLVLSKGSFLSIYHYCNTYFCLEIYQTCKGLLEPLCALVSEWSWWRISAFNLCP